MVIRNHSINGVEYIPNQKVANIKSGSSYFRIRLTGYVRSNSLLRRR